MKKEKFGIRKRVIKFLASCFMVTTFVTSTSKAMAFSITNEKKTFDKAWELSVTSDNSKAVLTYGYNTFAINEDYAHAYHSSKKHYAYVKNSNGSFAGSNVRDGKWSKIEVTHKGSSITYGNSY